MADKKPYFRNKKVVSNIEIEEYAIFTDSSRKKIKKILQLTTHGDVSSYSIFSTKLNIFNDFPNQLYFCFPVHPNDKKLLTIENIHINQFVIICRYV